MFKCRVKAKWKAKKLENLCGKVRRGKSHDIASCCGAAHCTLHKTSSFWIRANTFVTQNIKWVFLFSFILGKGQRQQCWKYCNIGPCRLQVSIGMVSIGFVVKKIGTKQALTTLSISSLSFHFLFIFSFSLHFLSIFSQPGCKAATSCATLVITDLLSEKESAALWTATTWFDLFRE